MRNQKGFTLLEILVVVMILGLLISLAAPRILGRTDEARVTKGMADIKAIETALGMYKLDSGNYPTTEQGLIALVEAPTQGPEARSYRADGYLERVPLDPWNRDFLYASDGRSYVIRSMGADGEEGGDGVDADLDSRNF